MAYNLAIKSENLYNTNEDFSLNKIIKNLYQDLTKGDVTSALKTYEEDLQIMTLRYF
jgi:hypothetical protein